MQPAAQAVERSQVAGGDPHQRDEVVAVPDAVPVRLAHSDAAAEQGAVEVGRVDLDLGGQVRVRVAEVQPVAVRLDQLQVAAPDPAEHLHAEAPAAALHGGHGRPAYDAERLLAW